MKHFAAISNGGLSHVQSACAIGNALRERGHRFTFFGTANQVARARQLDIDTHRMGVEDPSDDYGAAVLKNPNSFLGDVLRYMKKMTALLCEEAPPAFREHGVDFLLADQEEPGAAASADLANIPYITFCSSLPLNEDVSVPPSFVGWPARDDAWTRAKNLFVYRIRNLLVSGVNGVANRYRMSAGLPPYRKPDDSFSRLGHFSQLVEEFDFPRKILPPNFNYVGPFHRGSHKSVAFPYEQLDGRPLVYASLGTSQGARTDILLKIAEACARLPVQLVLSLGGLEIREEHRSFPGNPLIVKFAPQCELLNKSVVAIAHAGLNTAMEAMSAGVPLLAIPTNAGDQSGVAARIKYFGVGEVLKPKGLSAGAVEASVRALLENTRYREAARRMKAAIDRTEGAKQAAQLIEALAETNLPGHEQRREEESTRDKERQAG
jgi:MGT family glycosyltransferase